jgi:hypothetical protein
MPTLAPRKAVMIVITDASMPVVRLLELGGTHSLKNNSPFRTSATVVPVGQRINPASRFNAAKIAIPYIIPLHLFKTKQS